MTMLQSHGLATQTFLGGPTDALLADFQAVRRFTETLCDPLEPEDCVIQSMPDVSPTKWHLAHTSWFFERFLLQEHLPGYQPFHPQYDHLFNSYYQTLGTPFHRPSRGMLSRPTLREILKYRAHVDQGMTALLGDAAGDEAWLDVVTIGLNHEQQHQELLITDVKHVLSMNPLRPRYQAGDEDRQTASTSDSAPSMQWLSLPEGVRSIGYDGDGFAFDNESPCHRVFLDAFELASRPVTCGEYLAFMEAGGYQQPQWWLSMGWDTVTAEGWGAPLYWHAADGRWIQFTLQGLRPVVMDEPVCHVSYYEADAYARWAGASLPTEMQWEAALAELRVAGDAQLSDSLHLHPRPLRPRGGNGAGADGALRQATGYVWEWTASQYSAYPGYQPQAGALGEYNGKFMCNQFVLRGGSCATPAGHLRPTYRNFFPPQSRWQFAGIRLARTH